MHKNSLTVGNSVGSNNFTQRKRDCRRSISRNPSGGAGGADETRTRDLRRDREPNSVFHPILAGLRTVKSRFWEPKAVKRAVSFLSFSNFFLPFLYNYYDIEELNINYNQLFIWRIYIK